MSDVARTTGRGFLVIMGAKAWFLVSAAVINLGLPSFFDRHPDQGAAAFGDYGLVINLVSIFNMVMITGTLQAVSKVVSEEPAAAGLVVRRAIRVQLRLGVPLVLAYLLLAPWTADMLQDDRLTPLIRLSAAIVLMYSFYAIFVGYFNGTKRFTRQALLDIGFATLKAVLIVGAVLVGLGVSGAIGGFVGTAVVMTAVAAVWVLRTRRREGDGTVTAAAAESASERRILGYMLANLAYVLFLNVIIRADLFLLKSLSSIGFAEQGMTTELLEQASSRLSGIYNGMANVARLPYQAVIAITFVVFPVISRATFEGDRGASAGYIRNTLRYSALIIGGLATVLIADRETLLEALYPGEYGVGGDALMWLALGMVGFAILYVTTTILISAGRPLLSVLIAGVTMVLAVGLNAMWLSAGEVGDGMLERAGLATFVATALGATFGVILLARRFGAGMPALTLLRIAIAAALVVGVAPLVPIESLGDLLGGGRVVQLAAVGLKMAIFGIIFYAVLIALREFGQEDLSRLKSVLRRRSPTKEG